MREPVERMYRLSDQMVTAFSTLRDKCHRRALGLDLAIFALSLWATLAQILHEAYQIRLVFDFGEVGAWTTAMAFGIVLLSIVQLRVDWKGAEARYMRSCDLYSKAKAEARKARDLAEGCGDEDVAKAREAYEAAANGAEPIQERAFISLKRKHKLKIEVSRMVDKHPAAPESVIKAYLMWRDVRGVAGGER